MQTADHPAAGAPRSAAAWRRWMSPALLLLLLAVGLAVPAPLFAAAAPPPLKVVSDDNYPPYIFREADGTLAGYLVDAWALWEKKTGRRVTLIATDWADAQRIMQAGQADVIDTIFQTPEREKLYDFTPPYQDIPVPIYIHTSIGGVRDVKTLMGFLVGAKNGDACIDRLNSAGITSIRTYESYSALVRAAATGKIKIFCLDGPPADYLLYKAGVFSNFYKAFTLYTGQFHRAVRKGDAADLALVEQGFAAFSASEKQALRDKWFGATAKPRINLLYVGYGLSAVFLLALLLGGWVLILRHEVRRRVTDLDKERRRLHTVLETIPALVWLKDVNGVFVLCNREFELFFGGTQSDIVGKTDFDFVEADLAESFRENDRHALAAGGPTVNEEWVTYANDGRRVLLETIKTPIPDADGRPLGVLGIARDITAMRQAEEALRRNQEDLEDKVRQRTGELRLARDAAEAASKAKSIFLANMSHELRTPLNAILGFSALLRRDADLRAGQREKLDIINRSGNHLLALINDVLEMAKIESGRLHLLHEVFDLGGMVRDVVDMMRLRAETKGLSLLLDQSSSFPRFMRGDEARLRQILVNMVGNAVKFTEQGGVTLRLGTGAAVPAPLIIEVEDTGPGISPDNQARLFQPFVQLEARDTTEGTGLGLAITRQFVELMGGSIGVRSQPGRGSVFRVELPFEPVAEGETAPHASSAAPRPILGLAPGQPVVRILIAEDQADNQRLLTSLMDEIGLETRVAANGEECLALFADWHPQLIWMDRRMPVMDGVEAARRIRRLPGGDKVKIVAVTASVFEEQRQELMEAGLDAFVRKPYRPEEIYQCLAAQLGLVFVYGDTVEEDAPALLPSAALAALPSSVRAGLRSAVESLDSESIGAAIAQVAAHDPMLARSLTRLAGEFDYPAILAGLESVAG